MYWQMTLRSACAILRRAIHLMSAPRFCNRARQVYRTFKESRSVEAIGSSAEELADAHSEFSLKYEINLHSRSCRGFEKSFEIVSLLCAVIV